MNPFKYCLIFLTYLWLRFDIVLRIAFKNDWTPRYEFMASLFGEEDSEKFLAHRVKLVTARNKKLPPAILPGQVAKLTDEFIRQKIDTTKGRLKRQEIINTLLFWALDPEINQFNIESYQTRSAIVDNLLSVIFNNALIDEADTVLEGLKKIVFSRITYLGAKGEPSPIVHDVIISGVGRLLTSHFYEIIRLRDEKLDKLTKIKLIKEIQKNKDTAGSLAFSGEPNLKDELQHKFPLPDKTAAMLYRILEHYLYSAWADSREKTARLLADMKKQLGFSPEEFLKV